jgi:hypothetical protein
MAVAGAHRHSRGSIACDTALYQFSRSKARSSASLGARHAARTSETTGRCPRVHAQAGPTTFTRQALRNDLEIRGTRSAPSAAATIHTPASTDAAAEGDTDLCIQAASRAGLGFPLRQISPTPTSVAHAISAGFIPGLTSLPAADGHRYLYCYMASSIAMGTGPAQPASGLLSVTARDPGGRCSPP